ncbi:uncharacterized protein LOC143297064 [Babylonia areolata]|uniref:uncharacterized protein LOC143297064 n=1 Tax=Babylonia areolata TaxID=304850 RepID=UPI003FCF04F3
MPPRKQPARQGTAGTPVRTPEQTDELARWVRDELNRPKVSEEVKGEIAEEQSVYEKYAAIAKSSWPTRLIALLRGKAREAVLRLDLDHLTSYAKVKAALLRHFRLDADAYRKKFRALRKDAAETFEQLLIRMRACFSLWCVAAGKDENNVGEVKHLFMQSPELIMEVWKVSPKNADDLAKEATVLAEAKRMGREAKHERGTQERPVQNRHNVFFQPPTDTKTPLEQSKQVSPQGRQGRLRSAVVCFHCKKEGHIARNCPQLHYTAAVSCPVQVPQGVTPALCVPCARKPYTPRCIVTIEGMPANGLRDTGAGYTVVAERLVPADAYTGAVKTRAQTRKEGSVPEALSIKEQVIRTSRADLIRLQECDPSLAAARESCDEAVSHQTKDSQEGSNVARSRYSDVRASRDQEDQGSVFASFYWPGMCADIARYCQSCPKCQRTVDKGRVPLVKMPLMQEPFARVGLDIIGPIKPASESGCRYVLVIVDFATRYPEAAPLRTITAGVVAEAVFNLWTRTGIPSSVLTDRGTQFTGQVMQEVYRLLAIKGLQTIPYHAQCNGLVERFNETLKKMLQRLAQEKPQHQEVKTAAEYVVDLRNRIAESCAMAQENLTRAATRYKRHFDAKAKSRTFKRGDKVLILIPTKANKLELAWQGPYEVLDRVSEPDYKLRVGVKDKLFHANLLKRFIERHADESTKGASIQVVVVDESEGEGTDPVWRKDLPVIPLEPTEGPEDVVIGCASDQLVHKLRILVKEFGDVLTDLPACTQLETCKIKLSSDVPIRSKPYPLPYAQRDTVRDEIKMLLNMGAIEPSVSPYSSQIVLVKKKDGKIRFCVDYRRFNKVVEFDAEPMPEIEYLFSKLGQKRIFSKIDLSKGYWQIPVEEEDRPKTAFSTPEGHFQWRVMLFGLCTSGAVFSRMMRKLLQPLESDDIDNFIDDILIASHR